MGWPFFLAGKNLYHQTAVSAFLSNPNLRLGALCVAVLSGGSTPGHKAVALRRNPPPVLGPFTRISAYFRSLGM
jgi:hypothetical protein